MTTYNNENFQKAASLLRPTALNGVSSPFFEAALYLQAKGRFDEAKALLTNIPKEHWQFDEAIALERFLWKLERLLCTQEITRLKEENLKLRDLNPGGPYTSEPKNKDLFQKIIDTLPLPSTPNDTRDFNNPSIKTVETVETEKPLTFSFSQRKPNTKENGTTNRITPKTERPMKLHS